MIEDFINFFIQLGGILLFLFAVYFFLPENIKDKLNPFLKDLYTLLSKIYMNIFQRKSLNYMKMIDNMSVPEIKKLWKKSNDFDKKYMSKKIEFRKTILGEHHNKTIERIENYERQKNKKEIGRAWTDSERSNHEYRKKEKNRLIKKYGKTIASKIERQELWVGMSKEMLSEVKGTPDHKIEKVSRGKKREEYFYGEYKNRLKNWSYKFRVVIIEDKVDGWNDI